MDESWDFDFLPPGLGWTDLADPRVLMDEGVQVKALSTLGLGPHSFPPSSLVSTSASGNLLLPRLNTHYVLGKAFCHRHFIHLHILTLLILTLRVLGVPRPLRAFP